MRPSIRSMFAAVLMMLCLGRLHADSAHAQRTSVVRELPINALYMVYDPVSDKLFASIRDTNQIQVIDPASAAVEATIMVETNPQEMAVTDDGHYLYVSVLNETAIQKIDLLTRTPVSTFPLTGVTAGTQEVRQFETVPGSQNKVVVAQKPQFGQSFTALYDNGVRQPDMLSDMSRLQVASATRIYGSSSTHFFIAEIASTGLINPQFIPGLMDGEELKYDNGLIYASNGAVVDPEQQAMVGTFLLPNEYPGFGMVEPVSEFNRMFVFHGETETLLVYNQQTFQLFGKLVVPDGDALFGPRDLIAIGGHNLAMNTPNHIYFIDYHEFVTRPANLEANAGGLTTINLLWSDASLDEAGFRIERSPITSEAWQPIGSSSAPTYSDATVACGTAYNYRVTAYWSDGRTSDPSNVAQGQTNPCTPPPPTMIRKIPMKGSVDMVYDPASQMLYVGMRTVDNGAAANTIRALDPVTGNWGASAYIGSEPQQLALSDDGQYLYAYLSGAYAFRALHLPSMTAQQNQVSLGNGCYGPCYAYDLEVMPGNSQIIVVTKLNTQHDEDVSLYENGLLKSSAAPNSWTPADIVFGASNRLYGFVSGVLMTFAVDGTNLSVISETGDLIPDTPAAIEYNDGRIYASNGVVVDPVQGRVIAKASYLRGTAVEAVPEWNRVFIYSDFYNSAVFVYDLNTMARLGHMSIPISGNGYGYSLIRTGDHHLALLTHDALFLIDLSLYIDPPLTLEAAPISPNRIDLNWTQSGIDTDGIRIERTLDWTQGYQEIGTSPEKFYTDTGLACGTTYYYRIRAYRQRDGVVSEYSNGASAKTLPCTGATAIPATPTAISATSIPATPTAINATPTSVPLALGAGYYEETNPNIVYLSQWTTASSSRASGSSYRYSYRDDALIRFYFTGSAVTLIRQTASNRGEMQVCINGSCQIVNNYSASTLWQQPVGFTVGQGNHIVEIRSADGKTIDLDAIRIDGAGQAGLPTATPDPAGALGAGAHDDSAAAISYVGTWNNLNASRASGGSYHYSWRRDAAIRFSFTGSTLTLIRRMDTTRGEVEVCIDATCQRINNYAASTEWQQPISFATHEGTHTVEIRNTGGKTMDLDAIRVESSPSASNAAPSARLLAAALVGLLLIGRQFLWNRS